MKKNEKKRKIHDTSFDRHLSLVRRWKLVANLKSHLDEKSCQSAEVDAQHRLGHMQVCSYDVVNSVSGIIIIKPRISIFLIDLYHG